MLWGVVPLLPALLTGQVPGHPHTDLYPSVWGLGWFAHHLGEILPTFAPELGAPAGMGFYYASPLHGWLCAPLVPLLGTAGAYTVGILAARIGTVLAAFWAGRQVGLRPPGALVLAAVYGCSPFFHGYTVEGIVEGTDGWTLALWVGAIAGRRWGLAVVAAAFAVASSWYMAWAGTVVALALVPFRWRAALSWFAGIALASPLLWAFVSAFPAGSPLDPATRAAMGTSILPGAPGVLPGLAYAAKTSWIGLLTPILALASARRYPWLAAGAVLAWVLSLGIGPWYALPVWSAIRFPYRLHAATLVALGLLAAWTVERLAADRRWLGPVLAGAIVVEGLVLSPVEPIVPTSSAEVPALYRRQLADKMVLAIPGPVALPPGAINPSRGRARYLLYQAGEVGVISPWVPDFNHVGVGAAEPPWLDAVRSWDPLLHRTPQPLDLTAIRDAGVTAIVIHRDELGAGRTDQLVRKLRDAGAAVLEDDGQRVALGW